MIRAITLTAVAAVCFQPAAASAHVGHVGEVAGHAHWIGLAAAGAAAAIALWLAGRKGDAEPPKDDAEAEKEGDGETA